MKEAYEAGTKEDERALIGLLASHDSADANDRLAEVLNKAVTECPQLLEGFHFVFTGGTYSRLVEDKDNFAPGDAKREIRLTEQAKEFLKAEGRSSSLPSSRRGGVTILSYLVVQRMCRVVWAFLDPLTTHWLNPENLAMMRLCDQWHTKRLMNPASVQDWLRFEAQEDRERWPQRCPPELPLNAEHDFDRGDGMGICLKALDGKIATAEEAHPKPIREIESMRIALIAHDDMKGKMVDFALEFERELNQFKKILATGSTGREVREATKLQEDKIHLFYSGPKGGDIEIATVILTGQCDVVVFFVDPLHPHPHTEDIRVVFGACMIRKQVRMLTNEMQAREWMARVVRKQMRESRSSTE